MKVIGKNFYFHNKKKNLRGKILKVSKLSGKKTIAGQNSGEFCLLGWDEQCVKPLSSSFESRLNQVANVCYTDVEIKNVRCSWHKVGIKPHGV